MVNRLVEGTERERLLEESKGLKEVRLGAREISGFGVDCHRGLSPLEGFQGKSDYESILRNKRLANGLPWTIPITLSASRNEAVNFREGDRLSLVDLAGKVLGIMDLEEKFPQEREKEAKGVYGTNDQAHPGVAALYSTGDILLAGKVWVLNRPAHQDFQQYRLDPRASREVFQEKGWRSIVGFQTRNPVHRAHEYIQKVAMETVDGLFLHPRLEKPREMTFPRTSECSVMVLA